MNEHCNGPAPKWTMGSPILITYVTITFLVCSPIFSLECAAISVWPQPREFSWPTQQATLLSPSFTIESPHHQILSTSVERYLHLIMSKHFHPLSNPHANLTNGPTLTTLVVLVNDLGAPLSHGVNESYSLSIPTSGDRANLIAETVWGAMRGLETFSQLVWGKPSWVAVGVEVGDWPIFSHRGILLDTSRNYYKVEDILRTIGAMSANKLNVFSLAHH